MADQKCPACPASAPLWMVTFADLMALLLTLFVLLLTFSELNVIKYKAIAGSIRDAFAIAQVQKLAGVIEIEGKPLEEMREIPFKSDIPVISVEIPREDPTEDEFEVDETKPIEEQAEDVEDALASALEEELDNEEIELEREGNEVTIRFPSAIAFTSGRAGINQDFAAIIDEMAPVIKGANGDIIVAGHTDNIPLSGTGQFRSNWDLSAARATSVVHRLADYHDVPLERLTVRGYGESRPIVGNLTAEDRATNRRVEITLNMSRADANELTNGAAGPGEDGQGLLSIPTEGPATPETDAPSAVISIGQ